MPQRWQHTPTGAVDENDLAQFPLNNIKDLVHILKQIKDSKIDKMNYENQLVFLDNRTVERHVEILNDDETQLEETNLRKLINIISTIIGINYRHPVLYDKRIS